MKIIIIFSFYFFGCAVISEKQYVNADSPVFQPNVSFRDIYKSNVNWGIMTVNQQQEQRRNRNEEEKNLEATLKHEREMKAQAQVQDNTGAMTESEEEEMDKKISF